MREKSTQRLHSLDSLRGIAAIYVVFFHLLFVPRPVPVIPSVFFNQLIAFGGTGVFLFFVISGFSLSMTMGRHERSLFPLSSYGLSRLFRIAPLFYVLILISAFRDQLYFGARPSVSGVAANMVFVFNFFPGHQEGIVWASWTIGVEMIFYLIFPVIYRLQTLYLAGLVVATTLSFAIVYGYAPGYFYWSVVGYFPMFVVGMLAFKAYAATTFPRKQSLGLALITLGSIALIACAAVPNVEKNVMYREPIAIGYAAVMVGCLLVRPAILESRVLMFFGKISYSLYLIHAIVIYACSGLFVVVARAVPDALAYLACAVITFALATPLAYLATLTVEGPGNQLGAKVLAFMTQRHSMRSSAARR